MIETDSESDAEDITGWLVEVSFDQTKLVERYFSLHPSRTVAERAVADSIGTMSSSTFKAVMSLKRGQMNHLGLTPETVVKCTS